MIEINYNAQGFKTEKYLKKQTNKNLLPIFIKYAKMGIKALEEATPKDTGLTSESWRYEIKMDKANGAVYINWYNDNTIDEWYNVAMMIQYGHATGSGAWIEGIDYINPAMKPVFDKIAEEAWKEVSM